MRTAEGANSPTSESKPAKVQPHQRATKVPKSPSQRGKMARCKGQLGELEIVHMLRAITGFDVRRRVRQHEGDSDIEGIPGWSVEIKRHATVTPGKVAVWWRQTVEQAKYPRQQPVLFYRGDRGKWRAVWSDEPITLSGVVSADLDATLTSSPFVWYECAYQTWETHCSSDPGRTVQSAFCQSIDKFGS